MTTLIHHRGEPLGALRQAVTAWAFDNRSASPKDVSLLVDELVSNAVVHAHAMNVVIHLEVDGHATRIAVDDPSPLPPVPKQDVSAVDEHGRGLLMVGMLSVDWGWCPLPSGKQVWCRTR